MKKINTLRYNLQFFAGEGEGNDPGAGSNGNEPTNTTNNTEQPTFDELLKDSNYQSAFDKKVAKALETAKSKWQAEYDNKVEEAKTEAAKLAKMNAEQKAQYDQEKRIAELDKREKEITTRELKAQANVTLTEKGLPLELSDIINYTDADSCKASIDAVEKAFQSAVEKAVNEKLRGNGSPKGNSQPIAVDEMAAIRRAAGLK